jgi:hypothetical protein
MQRIIEEASALQARARATEQLRVVRGPCGGS